MTTAVPSLHILNPSLFHGTRYIRPSDPTTRIIAASLFLHPGLLLVDSIHFQYNGMLLGLLVLSLTCARDVSALLRIEHGRQYLPSI